MGFTTFIFPLFLVVTVFLYYILPKKIAWIALLGASWFFYAYNNLKVFILLPTFTLVTYLCARGIGAAKKPGLKKFLLIFSLIIVFGTLFVFKYLGLFAGSAFSLAKLFNENVPDFTVNIILPLGISFYAFQTAAYVIDVYLEKSKAERHFGYYALFVAFFPQLVAGPIERLDSLMPQLKEKHKFESENVKRGIALMMAGYIKKIVVADTIARVVDSVYGAEALGSLSGAAVIVATMLFFVQIYCDFSGYSDIALGAAKLMGISLMKNFDRPFLSESVTEFWSRWHISLSNWFNEYVYAPLAYKSMRKKNRMFYYCLNSAVVMLLSGFWHGANWTFFLWGALLAVYQIAETLLKKPFADRCAAKGVNRDTFIRRTLRRVRTFLLLVFSMVLFRAGSVSEAFTLYGRIFAGWNLSSLGAFTAQTSLSVPFAVIILLGIVLMTFTDRLVTSDNAASFVKKKNSILCYSFFIALWTILIAWSFLVANGQTNSFIYFQF